MMKPGPLEKVVSLIIHCRIDQGPTVMILQYYDPPVIDFRPLNLKGGHARNALATDRPIAGPLQDLHARGLLEEALVIWGGEAEMT